jgi:hypothetical protein
VIPATAMTAMSTPRSRFAAIIAGRGGCRSTHSPMGRVRKRNGRNSTVRSRLSCPASAPIAVMASTGTANVVIWVPIMETDWPPQNHRKSRLRQIDALSPDATSALVIVHLRVTCITQMKVT